jgi:ribonuclease D
MRDVTLITSAEQLSAAVFRMRGATRLAIDTEFMRERTYYPQLCLVQVASDTDCVLVDPLNGLDLGELLSLLAEPGRIKVVHAARQDLEVLYLAGGRVPLPVFDTQIAAALVGLAPQIGYAELVARRLGHSIDKGQTRTDWSRRPLSPEQLAYAADDVHHLLELHTSLLTELQQRGRRHWLDEDASVYADETLYRTEPAEAWRRLKGIGRLKPAQRAVARELARWREERAIASDRPRGWILHDEALLAIAAAAPRSLDELATVRGLQPTVLRKRGEELLGIVEAARGKDEEPEADLPGRRLEPDESALVGRLLDEVREESGRLGISAELLATRRDVEALVRDQRDQRDPALLRGWRRGAIGERLLALVAAAGLQAPVAARRNSE